MAQGYFITGTDTDVGKTLVSLALLQALKNQGHRVAGMKPISAGCKLANNELCNDDAIKLQHRSSIKIPYKTVNPYAFEPPVAPHLAAKNLGISIEIDNIVSSYRTIAAQVDRVIVEGAGGWLVPLDERRTMADIVDALALPVILVVGLRLGCLNHALLTVENIKMRGAILGGWVVNVIDASMSFKQQNIDTLKQRIDSPLLGIIPYQQPVIVDDAAMLLDVSLLDN